MKNKSQGVRLAWLNKIFFFLYSFFASSFLFSQCEALSLLDLEKSEKQIFKISSEVLDFFNSGSSKTLASFFHPRLKITKEKLDAFYQLEKFRLGIPLNSSLYRVWKISSKEEIAEDILCEKDGVSLLSHYGYSHQFNFWVNIFGKKEQGVLLFSLVPVNGNYVIGSFQVVKWSHMKKSYEDWVKEALKEKSKELSYLKLDIAKKLTLGDPFFKIEASKEIESLQEKLFLEKDFLKIYQKKLKTLELKSVKSIFNQNGIGLQFSYLPLDKRKESVNLEEDCLAIKASLGAMIQNLSGIRCELALKTSSSSSQESFFLDF
jgi:hypothetical protein